METLDPDAVRRARHARGTVGPGRRSGRRRRPSGEPPPLPRPINASGRFYLAVAVGLLLFVVALKAFDPLYRTLLAGDIAVLRWFEDLRGDPLDGLMRRLDGLGSEWVVRVLRWGTVLALLALRRFRHLVVFLGVSLVVETLESSLALQVGRLRPVGVEIVGHWDGYSFPSAPVVALGLSLMGVLYTLVPAGRWRNAAKWVAGVPIAGLCLARLYEGVDHPTDVIAALVVGMAIPVVAFRVFTPNEASPVDYTRRRSAHLDVGGARGAAIRRAVEYQLGLMVTAVEPFGQAGSAGSTPLRLRATAEDGQTEMLLFAKLYAVTHLRSDRWYKLWRAVRYGRLEDESTFSSVRRLVEYEDYLLRVMRDAGLPTAEPYGFVEITPEREYLLVTELFDGAVEMDDAEVDVKVIDDGLAVVRRMWDAGLAHRDIKPANILVRDGQVLVIDVAFGTVRPTPWRQAVDLANLMLTMALRSGAELVYERALLHFSEDEIAEAFAASGSVTVPAQLRHRLRSDGRDLVGSFRRLAPERRPIAVERWSLRRVGLLLGSVLAVGLAFLLLMVNLRNAGLR